MCFMCFLSRNSLFFLLQNSYFSHRVLLPEKVLKLKVTTDDSFVLVIYLLLFWKVFYAYGHPPFFWMVEKGKQRLRESDENIYALISYSGKENKWKHLTIAYQEEAAGIALVREVHSLRASIKWKFQMFQTLTSWYTAQLFSVCHRNVL